MSGELSAKQQQEIRQLQNMSQSLQMMQQNRLQMEAALNDSRRALEAITDLPDDGEIYRVSGQLLFRTEVPRVRSKLKEESELLEVRLKSVTSQMEDLEKRMKELDAKLRKEIGI